MQWRAVESSQISEVGHDSDNQTLGVRFKGKGKWAASEYHYQFVSDDLFQAMLTAESVGKFFAERIKAFPNDYPYTKVA